MFTCLLFVAFNNRRRTDLGFVRILAELAASPTLAKQIPALVQRNLLKPGLILLRQRRMAVEALLFMNQVGDPLEYGCVWCVLAIHNLIVP
jgi:hypothetical protein